MTDYAPPAEGVTTPPDPEFEMFLQGDESGHIELICTHPGCMTRGTKTHYNPRGLWQADVAGLPYRPTPQQIADAWDDHLLGAHGGAA